jgi:hypothetical protein
MTADIHEEPRRCCTCRVTKAASEFYFSNRSLGERQKYCKECKSAYNRAWYSKNRAKQIADVQRTNRRRRAEGRALLIELKSQPCTDCGGTFPPKAMDFDHVSGTKEAAISALVAQGAVMKRLLAEIAKCELVCANCHRIRTWRRRTARKGVPPARIELARRL